MNDYVNPRNYQFCPKCGHDLTEKYIHNEETKRLFCTNCEFIFYINPTPAVAVVVMDGDQILLVKRKYEPRKDDWTLPAGFMEYMESPEETAVREAKEETGLDIRVKEIYGAYPGLDDPRVHVVLIVYWAEIIGGTLSPGDDAIEVDFFYLNNLPGNIAFESHREILAQLKKKYRIE